MKKVQSENGFDYYMGYTRLGRAHYALVPVGHTAPDGGYFDVDTLCQHKGVPNLFPKADTEPEFSKNTRITKKSNRR